MQSTFVNDVKIYNLSMGKALPDWLSSRKRRKLLKTDAALRNRIQLIQDFAMPGVSQVIKISPDGKNIAVTGTYKPRMRCFDTNELAMKFERCFDYEVVKMEFLSDDWTKLMFLQNDRWLEFHSQGGKYFRIRLPKAGLDMSYVKSKCEVLIVGVGSCVNRLNLELGRFDSPLESSETSLLSCALNPHHELFISGSKNGIVEAFDVRTDKRVGRLDVAFNSVTQDTEVDGMPGVSCLSWKDSLHFSVGTLTGQILLYDIRSRKPLVVKDHFYGLPIKKTVFLPSTGHVASLDEKILKIWHEKDGSPYTAIQTSVDLNDLCVIPDTGMLMLANEDTKIQSFYLPSLGPSPKWASFLDRIVEEMEEDTEDKDSEAKNDTISFSTKASIYEDYKFVSEHQLQELGLEHLIGTNLLRAYMHGFFIDIRLYNKAKDLAAPFKYEEYKKKKIQDKLEASRSDRVVVKSKLPMVNRDLATSLMKKHGVDVIEDLSDEEDMQTPSSSSFDVSKLIKTVRQRVDQPDQDKEVNKLKDIRGKKKVKSDTAGALLRDDRFSALFHDKRFQVDTESEEYKSKMSIARATAVSVQKQRERRAK